MREEEGRDIPQARHELKEKGKVRSNIFCEQVHDESSNERLEVKSGEANPKFVRKYSEYLRCYAHWQELKSATMCSKSGAGTSEGD